MCRGKNKVKREEIVAENLPAREDSVRKTFLEFPTSSLKNRVAILWPVFVGIPSLLHSLWQSSDFRKDLINFLRLVSIRGFLLISQ